LAAGHRDVWRPRDDIDSEYAPEAEEDTHAEKANAIPRDDPDCTLDDRAFKHAAAMRMLRRASKRLLKLSHAVR
jgi:hypothetical protein